MADPETSFTLVAKTFDQMKERAFSRTALAAIFESYRFDWHLPRRMGPQTFIDCLLKETKMAQVTLRSPNYDDIVRYVWGTETAPTMLALSIKRAAYCSHGTAMYLHGLGGNEQTIFVNSEQSSKDPSHSDLTQEAIDRAFRNRQRTSNLIYRYRMTRIIVLNGKHTGRLGVERFKMPSGEEVEATSLERTLVEIVVRPAYAGGVSSVIEAFGRAHGRISTEVVLRLLKKLDHAYPYHQAIGFYMKRNGYSEADLQPLKAMGTPFHFYVGHGLKPLDFDPDFKVYFPKSLNASDSRG